MSDTIVSFLNIVIVLFLLQSPSLPCQQTNFVEKVPQCHMSILRNTMSPVTCRFYGMVDVEMLILILM